MDNLKAIKAKEWRTVRGLWEDYMSLENADRGYDPDKVSAARNKYYSAKHTYEKGFGKWHEDDAPEGAYPERAVVESAPAASERKAKEVSNQIAAAKEVILAPAGHNNPPADDPAAEFQRQMADDYAEVIAEAEKLMKGNPLDCSDDAYAERLTVYTSKLNGAIKKLEDARKQENEPVLKKQRIINGYFNGIKDKLEAKKLAAKTKLDPWMKKKAADAQAAAAAAAEKLRQEAATQSASQQALWDAGRPVEAGEAGRTAEKLERHAVKLDAVSTQAPTAGVAQVKVGTASASLRTVVVARITDRNTLDLEKLRPYLHNDALQKALDACVKATGTRDIKGAEIKEEQTTVVR